MQTTSKGSGPVTSTFFLVDEDELSIIIGTCPTCHASDRSLVVTDFYRNIAHPPKSRVHFKCLCCLSEYATQAAYIVQR